MAKENQELSKKHKIVAFLVVTTLSLVIGSVVLFLTSIFDETMDRQPRELAIFKKHSVTLEISNNTGDTYSFQKVKFPKASFINLRYDNATDKLYSSRSTQTNKILKSKILDDFLTTSLPSCKLTRNIKGIFNSEIEKGLSVVLESRDDQSSIKFNIMSTSDGYNIDILQTSSSLIELAPKNMHSGIDTFECNLKNNHKFIESINKLILNSSK